MVYTVVFDDSDHAKDLSKFIENWSASNYLSTLSIIGRGPLFPFVIR